MTLHVWIAEEDFGIELRSPAEILAHPDFNDCTVICPASEFSVSAFTAGAIERTRSTQCLFSLCFSASAILGMVTVPGEKPPSDTERFVLTATLDLLFLCQDEKVSCKFEGCWRHRGGMMTKESFRLPYELPIGYFIE
jgi:hypothetical protein